MQSVNHREREHDDTDMRAKEERAREEVYGGEDSDSAVLRVLLAAPVL
jgi:hypothetical protein